MGMLIILPTMERNSKENRCSGAIPSLANAQEKIPNWTREKAKSRRKRNANRKRREMGVEHG